MKSIDEIIKNNLKQMQGKDVIVVQEGFIESKSNIEKAKCNIEEDILNIDDGKNYIRINLNQIYNMEVNKNGMSLFLDNDTNIKIMYFE